MSVQREEPCAVCKTDEATTWMDGTDGVHQDCKQCGEFRISGSALSVLSNRAHLIPKLSGWIFDQQSIGQIPSISTNHLDFIERTPRIGVAERAERMLRHFSSLQKNLGDEFSCKTHKLIAATHSVNPNELDYLRDFLLEKNWIATGRSPKRFRITPQGHAKLEEISATRTSSSQAFVAMWFDKSMDEIFTNAIFPAVGNAGYDALRVDSIEHAGRIDDEIIRQIRQSRFLIADFTGHRGGVYFEAGFAMGLGLPVIWICRSDHMKDIHFDVRQYNCIEWDTADSLKSRLHRRIEAVLGRGPKPPLA